MSISEQVKELRNMAHGLKIGGYRESILVKMLDESADTIESLFEKLQAANMERSTENCGGGWSECESGKLPDKEVICVDYLIEMFPDVEIPKSEWKNNFISKFCTVV